MSGTRDSANPYSTTTTANDAGAELIEIVMKFYRERRGRFSSTEATNIGTAVTSILNGTFKV